MFRVCLSKYTQINDGLCSLRMGLMSFLGGFDHWVCSQELLDCSIKVGLKGSYNNKSCAK